jgi:hypothetical protein
MLVPFYTGLHGIIFQKTLNLFLQYSVLSFCSCIKRLPDLNIYFYRRVSFFDLIGLYAFYPELLFSFWFTFRTLSALKHTYGRMAGWIIIYYYYYLVCEAIGTVATPGLLCQPRVIAKMIVEKQMECRLAGETEALGENLPKRHFYPLQKPTRPDPGLNPGRRGGKPATNRLSYGAAMVGWMMNWKQFGKKRLRSRPFA